MSDNVVTPHQLADAVPGAESTPATPDATQGPTPATSAEQQREAEAGRQAENAQGGLRDRLVDIGKANHMGGRSKGRVSDS